MYVYVIDYSTMIRTLDAIELTHIFRQSILYTTVVTYCSNIILYHALYMYVQVLIVNVDLLLGRGPARTGNAVSLLSTPLFNVNHQVQYFIYFCEIDMRYGD